MTTSQPTDSAPESHYTPGSMDISAHQRAYASFVSSVKWSIIGAIVILVLLAIFRTHS